MKRLLLTFLGMAMLLAVHATGFETINGLKFLIDTDAQTATLVTDTVKYSGDIVVPEKVTLAGIEFPVVAFGKDCFNDCKSLTSVSIPSSVTSLGDYCFEGCSSLASITIPSSVTSLGDYCFEGCSSLASITIPSSVTSLGENCFWCCRSLASITIPSSVTSLGDRCFSYCSSLASITIPSSVTSLGDYCFEGCSSLASITIPSSVTSLGENCFQDCRSLASITIPSSVTSLGYMCFYYCSSLASITIPSSVTSLGDYCFWACRSLKSITIPSSVTSLGERCFLDCTSLASITIPSSVTSLGESCFYGCSSLASITIPSSVTSLGDKCFHNCRKLETVYCYAKNPPSSRSLEQPANTILYVPASSVDKYKEADGWKTFATILPIQGSEEDTKGKCEKPTITYVGGKLHFESSTSGAEYHYTLSCSDVASDNYNKDGSINLAIKYNITAYATADNYSPSDKATATLYWINASLDKATNINAAKTRGVLASAKDGVVTVSGLNDGEHVAFYSVDGKLIGTANAVNGVASYAVGNEQVVIAKIGGQSIKIAMK